MKEYKHLDRLPLVAKASVLIIALAHTSYGVLFYYFDIIDLFHFKVVEAAVSWVVVLLLRQLKEHHNVLIYYTRASVIFSCSVCHLYLGESYGFGVILMLMLAVGYVHNFRSQRAPIIATALETAAVIAVGAAGHFVSDYPSPYAWVFYACGLFCLGGSVLFYAGFSGLFSDKASAELAQQEEEKRLDSELDRLSGLYNRAAMSEILRSQQKIFSDSHDKSGADGGAKMALALLNVDGFKRVNAEFGHRYGDLVIYNLSELIRKAISGFDGRVYASRWSGQEFLISAINLSPEEFRNLIEKIVASSNHFTHTDGYHSGRIKLSAGICISSRGMELDALLHKADTALYNAKSSGGGGSCAVVLANERARRVSAS